MISNCELDAIDIVTPPATHAALIREAQDAGLHLICQKPLAQNADIAHAIVRKQKPELRAMVHENWRWRKPYRALKRALDTDQLSWPDTFDFRVNSSGLIKNAHGRYPALERQPFFADMKRLLVFELLIHHLDTLAFLFGELEIIKARLYRQSNVVAGEDGAEIKLSAGGIEGKLTGNFCVPGSQPTPRDQLLLSGISAPVIDRWSLNLPDQDKQEWDPETSYQDSYSDTIAHFVSCVARDDRFETELEDAAKLQTKVDEIYRLAVS